MMETGTLQELNVKPGDRVADRTDMEADVVMYEGQICVLYEHWDEPEERNAHDGYRIISRASDTQRTWGEMTDAEKGALLLAEYNGDQLQIWRGNDGWLDMNGRFNKRDHIAYRIRPEPKRETVTLIGGEANGFGFYQHGEASTETHKITFTTLDGEPDCASIKMYEI